MKNQDRKFIYVPSGEYEWAKTHAQIPTFYKTKDNKWRIYYTSRDIRGRSNISFIEVNPSNPSEVTYVHDKKLLDLGARGYFDHDGIMMSSIVDNGDKLILYYTGWNKIIGGANYSIAAGVAISYDDGLTFKKLFDGPILERDIYDPIFSAMPYVLKCKDVWKMWYVSCTEWRVIDDNAEPIYRIKYAESKNGIEWSKKNIVCIDYSYNGEAIARPSVLIENGIYKMWYSTRGSIQYRSNKISSYRIGYAESSDGMNWKRMDGSIDIAPLDSGWDDEMVCYGNVVKINDQKYMFYNGNGFGKSGMGYVIL